MSRLLIACLLLIALSAQAQVYRWVDENGQTVFSQSPPPDGQADVIKPPPPPAEDPDTAERHLQENLQHRRDQQEDRELKIKEQAKKKAASDRRKTNCEIARQNYQSLETATRRLIKMPDGSYKRLDDNERLQMMQEAQQQVEQNCK